jgi:hypothetical protein
MGSTSNNTKQRMHVSNMLVAASDNTATAMDKVRVITLDYISVSETSL